MKVVAEYVETPEQREKLLELGVDYLQGIWWVSRCR
jgi:EAL domain-containing protein (putative c-di-GMP-specific phosphodiesterase class I)